MKFSNPLTRYAGLLTIALLAALGTTVAQAAEQTFDSPDEAVQALQSAVQSKDRSALGKLFGPEYKFLLTGDKVQDEHNLDKFAAAMAEGTHPTNEADDKITITLGTNEWPMPIPLVKADGKWHFDSDAGKEEIMNRHIGKDELHAIGVCRGFVTAEQKYATMNTEASGGPVYAQKFKSTPGTKDGLYWETASYDNASPFGPLVAEAHAEGYGNHGSGRRPFHGYYFRILTRQGDAAPGGKMDYVEHGKLTKGFALVAYPDHWDQSGIMTFIVNQDGKVYQRNFGKKTSSVGRTMKEYNPDSEWTLSEDEGVQTAISEK
jgi:hypothetical protein